MSDTELSEGTRLMLPQDELSAATTPGIAATPGAPLLAPLEVDDADLERGVAGILFIADEPVTIAALAETLGIPSDRISTAVEAVRQRFDGIGVDLTEVAGGWRLMTATSARPVLERWIIGARHGRLTQAALETLAVVAYRQPITRLTVGEIRGVNPDGALRSLMARGLVVEVGREDGPGQAVLFGTTGQFLERMGLLSLDELPPLPPYLPDGPAPDEPEAGGLSELRRRLRDGSQRLGAGSGAGAGQVAAASHMRLTSSGLMDEDDDEDAMTPPIARVHRSDETEIVDLSERLEQAARSAMGRLRQVKAAQAEADAHTDAEAQAHADTEGDVEAESERDGGSTTASREGSRRG